MPDTDPGRDEDPNTETATATNVSKEVEIEEGDQVKTPVDVSSGSGIRTVEDAVFENEADCSSGVGTSAHAGEDVVAKVEATLSPEVAEEGRGPVMPTNKQGVELGGTRVVETEQTGVEMPQEEAATASTLAELTGELHQRAQELKVHAPPRISSANQPLSF